MAALAARPSVRESFHEQKTLAHLTRPIEDSGTLSYTRPDRLARITTAPVPERLIVDGSTLTIDHPPDKPRTLDLDDHPELGALVDAVRGTLSGDLALLRRHYRVGFEPPNQSGVWRITLTPLGSLARYLSVVRIAGIGVTLRQVDTVQANGDRSIMQVEPLR